jgi:hypothetical protein
VPGLRDVPEANGRAKDQSPVGHKVGHYFSGGLERIHAESATSAERELRPALRDELGMAFPRADRPG